MRLTTLLCLPLALTTTACLWGGSDDDAKQDAMMESNAVAMESTEPAMDMSAPVEVESPLPAYAAYGAPIASQMQLLDAVTFEMVTNDMDTYEGQNIRMIGMIEEVCQTKGCWLTISNNDQTVRVKFTDYGFFVPKNVSGKMAILSGTFQTEITPMDEARHYLEDAGKHAEAELITSDVESLTFTADSVLIRK